MPGRKSTISEIDKRVNTVYEFLLAGYSRTQIVQYVSEHWEVGERQAENYIARARDLQRLDAELERPQWMHEALAQLKDIQRAANKRNNHFAALKALELQAKLLRFDI